MELCKSLTIKKIVTRQMTVAPDKTMFKKFQESVDVSSVVNASCVPGDVTVLFSSPQTKKKKVVMFADDTDTSIVGVSNLEDVPCHSTPKKETTLSRVQHVGGSSTKSASQNVKENTSGGDSPKFNIKRNLMLQEPAFSMTPTNNNQNCTSDCDTTLLKQRREIQLLIVELKDRDKELNEMVASHHQQLAAWKQDRKRLLLLEQKNAKYDAQLTHRNEQLKKAVAQLNAYKSVHESDHSSLETTQEKLAKINEEKKEKETRMNTLEEEKKSLIASLKEVSSRVGHLEARELQLETVLKIKEKEINGANSLISELQNRIKQLTDRCKECQGIENTHVEQFDIKKKENEELKMERDKLKEDLKFKEEEVIQSYSKVNNFQKQLSILQHELVLYEEREKCKEELLESQRLKQDRVVAELRNLRELYERQQRELQLLHINLDNSNEIIAKQKNSFEDNSSVHSSSASKSYNHSKTSSDSMYHSPRKQTPYKPQNKTIDRHSPTRQSHHSHHSQQSSSSKSDAQEVKEIQYDPTSVRQRLFQNQDDGSMFSSPQFSNKKNEEVISEGATEDNQKLSFQDRLTHFLDDPISTTDEEESCLPSENGSTGMTPASPACKLHKLLLESKKMLQNLEHSTFQTLNLNQSANNTAMKDTSHEICHQTGDSGVGDERSSVSTSPQCHK